MNATRGVLVLGLSLLGGACFELGDGGAADGSTGEPVEPAEPIPECDASSFEPLCVGGDLLFCSDEGMVTERSCGDGACVFGSDGADCLWPLNEPCEGSYSSCTEPGGVHACVDGQWRFDACPPGGMCVGDTCYGPDATRCEPGEQRCEDGARIVCNEDGFEVGVPCPDDEVCQVADTGPRCVSASAVPCDSNAFVPICEESDQVLRCIEGWTFTQRCDDDERCFSSDIDATCHDARAEPCDPASTSPTCDSNVSMNCSTAGVWLETACADSEQCVVDQWCLPECTDAAACIPTEAPPCNGPSAFFCDGQSLAYCFGGSTVVLSPDCACVERDGVAACT